MTNPLSFSGLLVTTDTDSAQANLLSRRFRIKLIEHIPDNGFYLQLTDNRLELLQSGKQAPGAILIDFTHGKLAHRLKFGGGRGQPLARAVGMKAGFSPDIVDATAGLGRDGFVLASLGSRVILCERSSILAALLDNALQRATDDSEMGSWIAERLQLVYRDSAEYLSGLDEEQRPDVVYIDPMYPEKKGSALVKKEMLALQQLLGPDSDSAILLENALQTARRRVVIKRPKHASWLHEHKPDTSVESKNTRYDIYVTLSSTNV